MRAHGRSDEREGGRGGGKEREGMGEMLKVIEREQSNKKKKKEQIKREREREKASEFAPFSVVTFQ